MAIDGNTANVSQFRIGDCWNKVKDYLKKIFLLYLKLN